jgi:mannose-6-phosphate isomerase-like protein (cupin superfamily)
MRDRLVALGPSEIEVIDYDLGRSAAGGVQRAGFERMVAQVCLGKVSAVAAIPTVAGKARDLARCENVPRGRYRGIDRGPRFQVKRIVVKQGGRLSLQMHHHRAEHWVVVRGTARVTIGDETRIVHENESTYIPIGAKHHLENPGKIDLELIEVQTGSYLGEDDIVRIEDDYRRCESFAELCSKTAQPTCNNYTLAPIGENDRKAYALMAARDISDR